MSIAGFDESDWVLSIEPSDPASLDGGDSLLVELRAQYAAVSLGRFDWLPVPEEITATAAMLMLAAGASAQCAATDVYDAPYSATTGDLPMGAATGDLNNDGFIDVVTANNFRNANTNRASMKKR